jgi:hypothetical protein
VQISAAQHAVAGRAHLSERKPIGICIGSGFGVHNYARAGDNVGTGGATFLCFTKPGVEPSS